MKTLLKNAFVITMNEKEEMRSQLERMVKEFTKDELDMVMALCAEEHKNRKDIQYLATIPLL